MGATLFLRDLDWEKPRYLQLDKIHCFMSFVFLGLIYQISFFSVHPLAFLSLDTLTVSKHCLQSLGAKTPCQNHFHPRQIHQTW